MTELPTIYELMARVIADVDPVAKTDKHTQGYTYRGVDKVTIAADAALSKHNVIGPVPDTQQTTYEVAEVGSKRTPTRIAQVDVIYRVYGPRGDSIETRVPGEAMDSGDKSTPKAMSVAYRTALLQLLRIPTGEKDPNANDFQRSAPWTAPELVAKALKGKTSKDTLRRVFSLAGNANVLDSVVLNENNAEETLRELLKRLGDAAEDAPKRTAQRKPIREMPEPDLFDGGTSDGS